MLQKQQFFRVFYNLTLVCFFVFLFFSAFSSISLAQPIYSPNQNQQLNQDQPIPASLGELGAIDKVFYWIISGFGSIAGLLGSTLDYVIREFIIEFGLNFRESGFGVSVDLLWQTVRDLFNLALIFGLVYIGFQIILGINDSQAKRTIGLLVVAALLVNFSLFITKFIIDFSNITATEIYQLFQTEAGGQAEISLAFTNIFQLSGLLSILNSSFATGILFILFLLIVFSVLIYVFLAAAILVTIRFVLLIFCMIFSPLMFLGWVIPGLKSMTNKFWSTFLAQAFFAPALLFMLYVSYVIAIAYNDNLVIKEIRPGETLLNVFSQFLPFYILVMVFMVASLVIAKNMGAYGAATLLKIGDNLRKGAQGYAYSYTGGALSKGAMNLMDKSGMSNNAIGRGVRNTFKKGYEYGAGGSSLSKIRSDRDATKADITKNRSRMQGIADTKAGIKKVELAEQNEAELTSLRGRDYNTLSTDEKNRLLELETNQAAADKFITGLSKTEIEELTPQQREKYANRFSSEQVSKIMESDKINSTEKNTVYGKRVDTIKNKIGGNTPIPANTFKLTRDEIETLGFEWVAQNGHLLTATQFDDYIKNSKKVTPEVVETLKSRRKNELLSQIQTPTGAALILSELKKKPKDFAQLPTEVFTTNRTYDEVIPFLTVGTLEEIAKENKLDQAQRFNMRAYLSRPGRATPPEIIAYFRSDEGIKKYGP